MGTIKVLEMYFLTQMIVTQVVTLHLTQVVVTQVVTNSLSSIPFMFPVFLYMCIFSFQIKFKRERNEEMQFRQII